MIEDYVIGMIIGMVAIPGLIDALYAFLTRPSKVYYRLKGGRWIKRK